MRRQRLVNISRVRSGIAEQLRLTRELDYVRRVVEDRFPRRRRFQSELLAGAIRREYRNLRRRLRRLADLDPTKAPMIEEALECFSRCPPRPKPPPEPHGAASDFDQFAVDGPDTITAMLGDDDDADLDDYDDEDFGLREFDDP